ncbi:MAG: hypothetical protein KGL39_26990 [Patescibacteria group bacterium]|nr:hypothetical protein [Patescibacteria group bacterium]
MKRVALQHGEVILFPVSKLPKGETRQEIKVVVAHSETGHHHIVISNKPVDVMGDVEKHDLYIRLFEPAKLVHQKTTDKHRTLKVPAGIWKILHKSEYDPFAGLTRRVKD